MRSGKGKNRKKISFCLIRNKTHTHTVRGIRWVVIGGIINNTKGYAKVKKSCSTAHLLSRTHTCHFCFPSHRNCLRISKRHAVRILFSLQATSREFKYEQRALKILITRDGISKIVCVPKGPTAIGATFLSNRNKTDLISHVFRSTNH